MINGVFFSSFPPIIALDGSDSNADCSIRIGLSSCSKSQADELNHRGFFSLHRLFVLFFSIDFFRIFYLSVRLVMVGDERARTILRPTLFFLLTMEESSSYISRPMASNETCGLEDSPTRANVSDRMAVFVHVRSIPIR